MSGRATMRPSCLAFWTVTLRECAGKAVGTSILAPIVGALLGTGREP